MPKKNNYKLWLLRQEYLLMHELHQMLVHAGRASLGYLGLCAMSYNLKWSAWQSYDEASFDSAIFDRFHTRIRQNIPPQVGWLFTPGAVKPRIKWLEKQMETVKAEAEELLAG